ncbi:MAG: hypothetical protein ACREIC_00470 [Limisphaerales bacterium]
MKSQRSTAGFEGCSRFSRLAAWQAVHKKLLQDDASYRKRFRSYVVSVVCLSCVLLVFYLPFFGIRLFAPMTDVSIIIGITAIVGCLTLRQFHFQRQSIRRYSQSSHGG